MAIHEAIEKADGVVFRCTLSGSEADRWLEVPAWMFDRAACPDELRPADRIPFVSVGALSALTDLLQQALKAPLVIIECAAFGRIQILSRPESGRGP